MTDRTLYMHPNVAADMLRRGEITAHFMNDPSVKVVVDNFLPADGIYKSHAPVVIEMLAYREYVSRLTEARRRAGVDAS